MGRVYITPCLFSALLACGSADSPAPPPAPTPVAAPAAPAPAPVESAPPTKRLIALGDLHADLKTTLAALRLAGLVDEQGAWSGGDSVLVQTGDQTDRGPDSLEVLQLLMRLEGEAAAAGGRVVVLLGNHEVMNMMGDWRYVSPEDVSDFGTEDARRAAFAADGELGRWLRERPMVAVIDRTVFVHGGVHPRYAEMGLRRMNTLADAVIGGSLPREVLGDESPIWYRGYLQDDEPTACATLDRALLTLGARRMVVGHTTQDSGKIAARCGGKLLGIDVGLSSHYGAHTAALELRSGDAWALYPDEAIDLPDPGAP